LRLLFDNKGGYMRINDSVLYFPSIEITNETWVKSSLLLWDHIYRILPSRYTPQDNYLIQNCIDQDIVRSIHLETSDFHHITDKFLKFVDTIPFTPSGLENQEFDRVHYEKIDQRLFNLLENESIRFDSEGFFHMKRQFARGYMFFLSNTVSKRRNLMMATDNPDAWTVMPYFSEHGNFAEQVWNPIAEGFYTSLIFTDILPRSIETVNIKEIFDFVIKRKDERNRLRNVLTSFIQEVSRCSSYEQIEQLRSDFKKDISQAKKDFRKSSGFINNDLGYSILNVGVPVGLSLFSAIQQPEHDPYQISRILPSVFLGAIASYLDFRKTKLRWRMDSPYTFLVDIDHDLLSKKRFRHFTHSFNEFIND
jgi:hypothetical protein